MNPVPVIFLLTSLAAPGFAVNAATLPTVPAAATTSGLTNPQATQKATKTKPTVTSLPAVEVKASASGRRSGSLASYGNASLQDTPAAVTVISRQQLDNSQIRDLAGLVNLDASLGDGYAPVGYIQDLTIRGYPLDLATGFRINDLPVTGEQFIAFEDKQSVEVLKGLAGIDAGVMEPGGLVNYVSKRPANVHTLTVGTDSYGSRYGALDLGGWLTPDFGLRANLAWEGMHAYVQHAHGHRHLLSIAAEWHISPNATLRLDSDQVLYAQRSASAYQLLGGDVIPSNASPERMLAYEPWQEPTTVRANNTSVRLNVDLTKTLRVALAAGHSRSVVDDNASFAYGCYDSPDCGAGTTPAAWFAPNGDYDVWDFRSPGETYVDDEVRATADGRVSTGPVQQDLTFGMSLFHHTVALPNEVFSDIGTANIDEVTPPFYPISPEQPGPVIPRLNSWQRTLFALDRVHMGDDWQVIAGAHFTRLDEQAWNSDGSPEPYSRLEKALPQAAVLWTPTATLTTYLSYSQGLSLGAQAPYWTSNAGDTLAPRLSRQLEAGVKYHWHEHLDLEAALFRIHQPYQFAEPGASASTYTFVQRGNEVHTGVELTAHDQVSRNLHVNASVALIQARAQDTGVPAYEGHQVVNVPLLRTTVSVDYQLPTLPKFALLGGWRYASPDPATPDGRVNTPAYNVFDAGFSYATTWDARRVVWRLAIDNVFDRFYWRFTGSDGNDSYLLPGAPRLARLSISVDL